MEIRNTGSSARGVKKMRLRTVDLLRLCQMQSEAHGWEAQSFPVTSQGSEPGVSSLIKQ